MCFVLYVGTSNPLPRRKFDKDSLDLSVESLSERDAAIKQYFSKPEVQYVGSTSGCGCDFPHATLQNGRWPELGYHDEDAEKDELDIAREVSDRQNCNALVALLRTSGNETVELYGVWDGDFAKAPRARQEVSINELIGRNFRFKEQGFYKVHLEPTTGI